MSLHRLTNFPLLTFVISFIVLRLSVWLGVRFRNWRSLSEGDREDFGIILAAALTLLGLIIGFSFSMSVSRYDQRKNYEEAEANAIGTEYVRADFLPAADAARVTTLLASYLHQRILFYQSSDLEELARINADTAHLQADLWSAVRAPTLAQPTPVNALVAAGMNDVLNSQGYTQAAWWNRIPPTAWVLMAAIAICCNLLVGYGSHRTKVQGPLFLVLPLLLSISLLLIADIDSPRGGLIRVTPQNLLSLADSLHAQKAVQSKP
ncbi:MAG TPA: hypothetical protein VH351_19150 [Bryobacteraceae bacterium]|jgi:hypothetical protein|nr:hypothetical protein [Bryobacteraceae bacterium]